jgi:hypothetical protein
VLKHFAIAITAAMVLASVAAGTAAAEDGPGRRTVELHQHQGIGPGGIKPPMTHHHHGRH